MNPFVRKPLKDKVLWGRMIENTVGAKLFSSVQEAGGELFYWRERDDEVDYVVKIGKRLIAIEVKSGLYSEMLKIPSAFTHRYENTEHLFIIRDARKNNEKNAGARFVTLQHFFENPGKSIGL